MELPTILYDFSFWFAHKLGINTDMLFLKKPAVLNM